MNRPDTERRIVIRRGSIQLLGANVTDAEMRVLQAIAKRISREPVEKSCAPQKEAA